jgi:hypothetical protein
MNPTQEDIYEALDRIDTGHIYAPALCDRARLIRYLETLATAYRAEKIISHNLCENWERMYDNMKDRADLAERQYAELEKSIEEAFIQFPDENKLRHFMYMPGRHEAERMGIETTGGNNNGA